MRKMIRTCDLCVEEFESEKSNTLQLCSSTSVGYASGAEILFNIELCDSCCKKVRIQFSNADSRSDMRQPINVLGER